MTPKLQRLLNDYKAMTQLTASDKRISFEVKGNPPIEYLVTYRCYGLLDMGAGAEPKEQYSFQLRFVLPPEYPTAPPQIECLQPIFHPNFSGRSVCFGARHWRAGETLRDLVLRIGRMIQYESVNEKDPFNSRSLEWYRDHRTSDIFSVTPVPFSSAQ